MLRACSWALHSSIMALVHGEGQDRWYFTKEELQRTPSVLCGIDPAKELSYRQQSANLIQDMGQRLLVSQLTINTAIVYMHRFYMFHSFSNMNRNVIAPCCLFLSAKLEEQPRKLEHVIKVANICLHQNEHLDAKSETYLQQAQDLVMNESILLQTLGFELTVDHPHTHVVRITQLVRASKDLAQTSYFMATNSLHLTPFCIQHKPSVVACVCIHLACKWSNWEFPRSSDNKEWWEYVDPTVTKETLDNICQEFLTIIENCPSRLKRRISTVTIYKGGHRPKSSGEKSSKSGTSTSNGDSTLKGESSKKVQESSFKGETSRKELSSRIERLTHKEMSSVVDNGKGKSNESVSESTLTITSNAAVVETATSKVMLPPLQPLTTKYANLPPNLSKQEMPTKSSFSSKDESKVVVGIKHKHREHDESASPAKKLKSMHFSISHGSHPKQPPSSARPTSQLKHSLHLSSRSSSHQSTSTSHSSKLPVKSSFSHTGQPHNGSLSTKSSSGHGAHAHYSLSPKLPAKHSLSHGTSSSHSSSKRHSHPGHPASSHTSSSHSSGSKMSSSHKHNSPLDHKKSSGERHRRPSSSSTKHKQEMSSSGMPLTSTGAHSKQDRIREEKGMKQMTDDFSSPPGPQRFHKLPTSSPLNSLKASSHHGPPLSSGGQSAPLPPLPPNLPPPPPPPPT